jgi:hypothetical protein
MRLSLGATSAKKRLAQPHSQHATTSSEEMPRTVSGEIDVVGARLRAIRITSASTGSMRRGDIVFTEI